VPSPLDVALNQSPALSVGAHLLFAAALLGFTILTTRILLGRLRIMDVPNDRSAHARPMPTSGGIAIVMTFLVGLLAMATQNPYIRQRYFLAFIVSIVAIAVVSFYDDVKRKPFTVKLLTQVVAVVIVLASGIVVDEIWLPFVGSVSLGPFAYVVSFLWILGLTNAFNFMDGLDGLAVGVAAVTSLFFLLITYSRGSTFVYINSYAVLAAALGFLVFNFPPARIFMGDVGSASLGFILATLAIIGARYDQSHTSFMVMPLLLFTFIFDTAVTLVRRWWSGERVTQPHRSHLYQLTHRLGWSQRKVAFFHYLLAAIQGLLAIWMVSTPGTTRALVFIPVIAVHLLYAVAVLRAARRAGLLPQPVTDTAGAAMGSEHLAQR
jgi:UDP-GlcNAc:undecaprenyl-phosphate GlcNAc-1-phosphate transferase